MKQQTNWIGIFFNALAATVVGWFVLWGLWTLFVIMPVYLYTKHQCLKAGYPKAEVTTFLGRFCIDPLDQTFTNMRELK